MAAGKPAIARDDPNAWWAPVPRGAKPSLKLLAQWPSRVGASVSMSNDGARVALGGAVAGPTVVLEAATGKVRCELPQSNAAHLLPDGERVAIIGEAAAVHRADTGAGLVALR